MAALQCQYRDVVLTGWDHDQVGSVRGSLRHLGAAAAQYGRIDRRPQKESWYACRLKISRSSCVTPSGYRSSVAKRSSRAAVVR
jgi:hypothetical protein